MHVSVKSYVRECAEVMMNDDLSANYRDPEAAFAELLREKRPGYSTGASPMALAPYQRGRVSLPGKLVDVKQIDDLTSARGRYYLEGQGERMLESSAVEVEEMGADDLICIDPFLIGNKRRYARFIRDLKARGLLTFSSTCRERVGLFLSRRSRASCA